MNSAFCKKGIDLNLATYGPFHSLGDKGIVYNEMKGASSSASARLSEALNLLFSLMSLMDYNSGGDPKEIPQLTYEELKQFYQTYYHPSRCLFFSMAICPLEHHLDFIADHTLNHTTKRLPSLPPIPLQPRFTAPVYRELTYPIAPEEGIKRQNPDSLWMADMPYS